MKPISFSVRAVLLAALPAAVAAQTLDPKPATAANTPPVAATDAADTAHAAHIGATPARQIAAVQLEPVLVSGARGSAAASIPASTETVTAEQLQKRVFVNVEDALKYAPNLHIRKRYSGDRNALIGGRSSSNLQAARGVVYADGVLLSNFLGNFNAPRWNMVAPEEVSRVDVFYGPFSALYPGNSIGTTVLITTREPELPEASGRIQVMSQQFEDYGLEQSFNGQQSSAFAGSAFGKLKISLGVNQFDNESQPMQYATPDSRYNPAAGTPVAVTGARIDINPQGARRLILGPNGTALEDNQQQQGKLKASYDFGPVALTALSGFWRNSYDRRGISFLKDANGSPVFAGNIRVEGENFTVANNAFSPQFGVEEHWMNALTLRSDRIHGWAFNAVASVYNIARDDQHTSLRPPNEAVNGGAGQIFDGSGTGWWNLDLQGNWKSQDKAHTLTVGYYHSHYQLKNLTRNASDYRQTATTIANGFFGKTLTQAIYAQDVWKFLPAWSTTVGLRGERWEAYDGARSNATRTLDYAERSIEAVSPKLSLRYAPSDWSLRYSVGKGVRFPTVSELFQGSISGVNIVNNDPNLRAESSIAHDLSFEKTLANGEVRVSLYRDDIKDTIFSQTNLLVTPSVTNIQNIPRVLTQWLDVSGDRGDLLLAGRRLHDNDALAAYGVYGNPAFAPSEGKRWVRVPRVRANLVLDQALGDLLNLNLAVRYSGRQFSMLDNSDTNDRVFGGVSRFTVVDAKASLKLGPHFDLALGLENALDERYYAFHPFPGRTLLVELRGQL